MGIKLVCPDCEKAVAGTTLMRLDEDDYPDHIKGEVMEQLDGVNSVLQKEGRGVFVQASTLGSLEALLEFLRQLKPPIPVAGFNIGPVNKKDIINASIMLEHKREYATILAFDVKVTKEAGDHAKELGVKIFTADIIYHLFDNFTAYMDEINGSRKNAAKQKAVFPCLLEILPQHIFNKKDPIVMGVRITEGKLKVNTPLCVARINHSKEEGATAKTILNIGKVSSIENNGKAVQVAKPGDEVAIKIDQNMEQNYIMYGRQFDHTNEVVSVLSRTSIDLLKQNFKDEMEDEDWRLVIKLKKFLGIM